VDNKLFLINFILLTWYFFSLSSIPLPCVFSFLFISINATKYYDYSDYFLTIPFTATTINFSSLLLSLLCDIFCVLTCFRYTTFVFKLMLMFFRELFLCLMFLCCGWLWGIFIGGWAAVWGVDRWRMLRFCVVFAVVVRNYVLLWDLFLESSLEDVMNHPSKWLDTKNALQSPTTSNHLSQLPYSIKEALTSSINFSQA
jgi:hypothetical protein